MPFGIGPVDSSILGPAAGGGDAKSTLIQLLPLLISGGLGAAFGGAAGAGSALGTGSSIMLDQMNRREDRQERQGEAARQSREALLNRQATARNIGLTGDEDRKTQALEHDHARDIFKRTVDANRELAELNITSREKVAGLQEAGMNARLAQQFIFTQGENQKERESRSGDVKKQIETQLKIAELRNKMAQNGTETFMTNMGPMALTKGEDGTFKVQSVFFPNGIDPEDDDAVRAFSFMFLTDPETRRLLSDSELDRVVDSSMDVARTVIRNSPFSGGPSGGAAGAVPPAAPPTPEVEDPNPTPGKVFDPSRSLQGLLFGNREFPQEPSPGSLFAQEDERRSNLLTGGLNGPAVNGPNQFLQELLKRAQPLTPEELTAGIRGR